MFVFPLGTLDVFTVNLKNSLSVRSVFHGERVLDSFGNFRDENNITINIKKINIFYGVLKKNIRYFNLFRR